VITRKIFAALCASVLMFCGCDDPNEFDFGRFKHLPNQPKAVDAQPAEQEPVAQNRPRWDAPQRDDNEDARESDSTSTDNNRSGWGKSRPVPSDNMPGDQANWDEDRERASDSLPSRTEKWGKDRELPSDSPNWGRDRKMPSDSAFRRSSDDDSESRSTKSEATAPVEKAEQEDPPKSNDE
jgi:hypothetical protein